MSTTPITEYWLRGPVKDVPALLQPVAHALLQAREEVVASVRGLANEQMWIMPGGMASAGFHLQHLTGVLSRLFTYARGEQLSAEQLVYLSQEGKHPVKIEIPLLLDRFHKQVDECIIQLKNTDPLSLTEERFVGRKKISSTVIGLLFHAAEHTMRHTGQLIVTVTFVKATT